MRRWNGWGDESIHYPLPESAVRYLSDQVGEGQPAPDISLEGALAAVPPSRLTAHPLVSCEPLERLLHARGQSLPDWIALRSGKIGAFPDGVAYPTTEAEVRELLAYTRQVGAVLIPYGGGTSVVGHINPQPGEAPVLTVDLTRLASLVDLDEISRLATFGAGVRGPELEKALNAHGYTLGHFPQSFELSTLGGWIAARSSGQQSYHYGRIEALFAGGHVETPAGPLDLPSLPASAAGPDLRQLVLGSEGRLGLITSATVRIRPLPETEFFSGIFFRDWQSGVEAVRRIAQERVPVSLLRLSNARETDTTLALSGKENLVSWADRGLRLAGYGSGRSLLILGVTGSRRAAAAAQRSAQAILRAGGGLPAGGLIGRMWRKSRFLTPYLRNTLWERGYALDTLETAVPWARLLPLAGQVEAVLKSGLAEAGERVLVFAHLSHVYCDGASLYVTYLFRRSVDPEENRDRWSSLKDAASRVILAHGGTISHQHGVGLDHAAYLSTEKGKLGLSILSSALLAADPGRLLNPGKLYLQEARDVESELA